MSENNIFDEYAELVKRYKAGDADAFSAIYEKSGRFVYATCLGVLGNPEDAKDAMQETYISVFNNIDSLKDERNLLGWIKRIAVNKSNDMFRKKKGETYYDDAIASEEIIEGNDNLEDLPDYFIVEKSKRDTLHSLMKSELSEVQYQTIFLHYYDEMPVEDIASVMGCPEGTVKTRLKSARVLIRKAVEKYEKDYGDSLAGAGAVPFLTSFFRAQAGGLTIPDVTSAIKPGLAPASQAGSAAGSHAGAAAAGKSAAAKAGGAAAAKAGGAAAAKAGFLATALGKGVALVAAAAFMVPAGLGVKYVIDNVKDDGQKDIEVEEQTKQTEPEVIETTVETTVETVPETTEPTESETEPTETEPAGPVDIDVNDLPDRDQLNHFISRWTCHEYNSANVPDDFVFNPLLMCEQGTQVDFAAYFDDYDNSIFPEDPRGLFSPYGGCHRLAYDQLVWVEENVLNISAQDIERINSNITATDDGGYYRGGYISDGYVWFNGGMGGFTVSEMVIDAQTDGQYYYLTTVFYDDLMIENNPNYSPLRDGQRFDYVMEYEGEEGSGVWSIVSCSPSDSTYSDDDRSALLLFLPEAYSCPDTGWKAAYTEIVQSTTPEIFDAGYHSGRYSEITCDLVLINDDDIPELIVSVGITDDETQYSHLYTFVDGEAVLLRSLYGYPGYRNSYAPRRNIIVTGGGSEYNGAYFNTFVAHMSDDCRTVDNLSLSRSNYDMIAYEYPYEDPNLNSGAVYYYYFDPDTYQHVQISEEEFNSYIPGSDSQMLFGTMSVQNFVEALSI